MNADLVARARDGLPRRLNAGILMGDGGFCVLGWMLLTAASTRSPCTPTRWA